MHGHTVRWWLSTTFRMRCTKCFFFEVLHFFSFHRGIVICGRAGAMFILTTWPCWVPVVCRVSHCKHQKSLGRQMPTDVTCSLQGRQTKKDSRTLQFLVGACWISRVPYSIWSIKNCNMSVLKVRAAWGTFIKNCFVLSLVTLVLQNLYIYIF